MTIIAQQRQLTADQEVALAKTIECGLFAAKLLADGDFKLADEQELRVLSEAGERAHQALFVANLGLVGSLAKLWAARARLDVSELYQHGCVGLGEAIQLWDWRRGFKFSTLAWKRINVVIADAAAVRCGQIDAPISVAKEAIAMRREWGRMQSQAGGELSVAQFAHAQGQSEFRVLRLLTLHSGNEPMPEAFNLSSPESVDPLPSDWQRCLSGLERQVIGLRYCVDQPLTLAAVAEELGISTSTVRRIELRALAKLRATLSAA